MTDASKIEQAAPLLLDVGLRDLAGDYDLILCDVWGVVHNGVAHHPAAADALQRFRRGGGTVVLITNAPAPAANVQQRMNSLHVPPGICDAIATSGDVTACLIAERDCPPLYHIGPDREFALYQEAERLGHRAPKLVAIDQAEIVIAIGPSDEHAERLEDYDADLALMNARGLTMICANPDIVVEVGDRLEYCAGAIAERYERIGGPVIQAGKPFPAIYERAMKLAAAAIGEAKLRAIPKSRILAIGDAAHTDLQGAHDLGCDALFITSGVHRAELHGETRGAPLIKAALHQFLEPRGLRPRAASPFLRW